MTFPWPGASATGSPTWRIRSSPSSGPGKNPIAPTIRSCAGSWPARRRKRMPRSGGSMFRVGLVILVAFAVLATGIFLIGDKNNLFSRKNRYFIEFNSVSGLKPGNPVQLNGVDVGTVDRVVLPENPSEEHIQVWISVDAHYGGRIRGPVDPM